MQCKYVGILNDPDLRFGQRCEHPTMTEADKDAQSTVYRDGVNGDDDRLIVLFPSKDCDHGLCKHHYYSKYFLKYGRGR